MSPDLLTDSEVKDAIDLYGHPSYHNLSKFHSQYLEELWAEARVRKLKQMPPDREFLGHAKPKGKA